MTVTFDSLFFEMGCQQWDVYRHALHFDHNGNQVKVITTDDQVAEQIKNKYNIQTSKKFTDTADWTVVHNTLLDKSIALSDQDKKLTLVAGSADALEQIQRISQ
jgi:methyl coenzyme M reductase alpha subunit